MPTPRATKKMLGFTDIDGSVRKRIHKVLKGTGVTASDFLRNTVCDRLDEIEEADRNVASERAARVRMACPTTMNKGDIFLSTIKET